VSFAYDARPPVIKEFSSTLWRGDKIGIIGPNGSGKTTLLKLLLAQLEPTSGSVKHGTNLQILYLDQLRGQIDDAKSLKENVAGHAEMVTFMGRSRHIHGYLQDFLFDAEQVRMPARFLSGGERNRLLLAKLFLQPANVLVLDEPTNDLDAETLELLEDILLNYEGTLLLVSHDRVFLDNVVTSTLVFEGNGFVTEYTGGYSDWVRQRPGVLNPRPIVKPAPAAVPPAPKTKSERPKKFPLRDKRELEELPVQIEKWESEQAFITKKLWDPTIHQNEAVKIPLLKAELSVLEGKIKEAYSRWQDLEKLRQEIEN
ncbi:MAG: ATP-binding cassette domain-containing protein, partial [Verrucomicrobiota bacterium]|nr:ATP-binding cassette domain-containing protein [Verrucomicrobiota bacterium]